MKGPSPFLSCSWLLFLVTVTMFTPGLLILYVNVVLKKAPVSSVEQASGILTPKLCFYFPRISFCRPFWLLINSHTAFSLSLSGFLSVSPAVRPWTAMVAKREGTLPCLISCSGIMCGFSYLFYLRRSTHNEMEKNRYVWMSLCGYVTSFVPICFVPVLSQPNLRFNLTMRLKYWFKSCAISVVINWSPPLY